MHFLTFISKNLFRRRMRTLLTVVGLGVAVAAVVSLVGISQGFERSYLKLYAKSQTDLVVQQAAGTMQLTATLDESLGERMAEVPGVKSVIGGLVDVISFEQFDLFFVLVNGWDPKTPLFGTIDIVEGTKFTENDKNVVMLGKILAANLGKHAGEKVEMYAQEFKVIGIYESQSVYENGAAIMPLPQMQRLMDRPGKVTGFVVQVDNPTDPGRVMEVARRIEELQPGLSAQPVSDFVKNVSQIRITRAMAWLTSTISLVLGAIGVLNTMIMSVFERTREIGTLRAIGWKKLRVMRMILSESLLLSLLGGAVGAVAAVLMLRVLSRMPLTSGLIEGDVALPVILQGFAIAAIVGLLGAAYPAYWGANLAPVEAMRKK
jgi:putative ABC transport system permease protein